MTDFFVSRVLIKLFNQKLNVFVLIGFREVFFSILCLTRGQANNLIQSILKILFSTFFFIFLIRSKLFHIIQEIFSVYEPKQFIWPLSSIFGPKYVIQVDHTVPNDLSYWQSNISSEQINLFFVDLLFMQTEKNPFKWMSMSI